jgi:hypothetical protein
MSGTRRRPPRAPDPVDSGDGTPPAKRAKNGCAHFVCIPRELQMAILEAFYNEPGIPVKEATRRLGTVRLLCKCTSGWGRRPLAVNTMMRELERRDGLRAALAGCTFASVAKAILAKDSFVHVLFATMIEGTNGVAALNGLRAIGQMFDKEERWLIKCRDHIAAGNVSLDGIWPDA